MENLQIWFISFIFLTYPYTYLIFWRKDFLKIYHNDKDIFSILVLPFLIHVTVKVLLIKKFFKFIKYLIEVYYKNKYKKIDNELNDYILKVDIYNEENWNNELLWKRNIKKNKFYNLL